MTGRLKLGAQALAVLLVAGLLALLIWKVTHGNGGGVAAKIGRGKIVAAPNFNLSRLDRPGRLQLASLRGKTIVLNFWASWCFPCTQEAKALERAWRDQDGDVVFVGVDVNDLSSEARKFMRQHHVTYPIVHDNSYAMWNQYGLTYLPATFFVNPRGRVVGYYQGQLTGSLLHDGIDRALKS
jgi:cytochrome c biogenesis protein CcmG/thiol:disulfide interchange protein DsbE